MPLLLSSLFIVQLFTVYWLSRKSIRQIFILLHKLIPHKPTIFMIIAFIFLPGTILHELSHFLMAIVLLLKVRAIHIFPEWSNTYLKLGSVLYEKKDVIRSIIVGIAPLIVGLLFFWWMSVVGVLSIEGIGLKAIVIYLIFVISSTMFSSKQDLVDAVYVLPILVIVGILFYIFPIDLSFITRQELLIDAVQKFLYDVNIYLGISLFIHSVLLLILSLLIYLLKN